MEYLVLFAPEIGALATKRNDVQTQLTVEELRKLIDMLDDELLRVWSERIREEEMMEKPNVMEYIGEI
jgi:hypothetical protein